jgi:hypothetical protein
LAGWQHKYDTGIGKQLITDMVARDVNHPCVVMWDNGNESGWNTALDTVYGNRDPQKRGVMHPGGGNFGGVNDVHYDPYANVQSNLGGSTIYLPTEFLHGLYDGGQGAGLYDYWNLMSSKTISAGGFLWSFIDEGVVRTDQNNIIDTKGNSAPDGILGPYREKEGSYYSVKEIWSPAYIDLDTLPASFDGTIALENRFDFINTSACSFIWKLVNFDFSASDTGRSVAKSGTAAAPSIAPHAQGQLSLNLPADWKNYQGLLLTASDPFNREIFTWSWMIKSASEIRKTIVDTAGGAAATFAETNAAVTVTAGVMQYTFSKATGRLIGVQKNGKTISLSNGPAQTQDTSTISSIATAARGSAVVITALLSRGMQSITWTVFGNGWLKLAYGYSLNGSYDYYGVNFDYPETKAASLQWLGKGPYHCWKNRMKGGSYNVWRTAYNDGIAGQNWVFPEFKGYFDDVKWAKLITSEDTMNFVFDDGNVFYRNFTQKNGSTPLSANMTFPTGNISFLQGISPIGNKFQSASQTGPQGKKNTVNGSFIKTVYMYFGKPKAQTAALPKSDLVARGSGLEISAGCRGAASIRFYSNANVETRIVVCDVLGRMVKILFSGSAKPGWHALDARNLPGGVYFVKMTVKGTITASEKFFSAPALGD